MFGDFIFNPGHVVQCSKLMDLIHVAFVGNPSHAGRYLMACSPMGIFYTLLMDFPGYGWLSSKVSKFLFPTLGCHGTLCSPLFMHLHPVSIACTDACNFN